LERSLAERLRLQVGHRVTLQVLEGKRRTIEVPVSTIVDEWLGMTAYISPELAKVVLDDGGSVNGAWLRIDRKQWPDLLQQLKQTPWLSASVMKQDVKQKMQDMLDRSMGFATFLNALFAGAIAFGVIYNNLRIALSEGGRDLASLRVLGFSHAEVTRMLVTEQWLIIVAALPVGLIAGYGLCAWLSQLLVTDAYRLPLVVSVATYGNAGIIVFVAAALSSVIVARRIRRMDLVAVLKTRE
jgi:putative ABC transport system permease protein